MGCYYLRHRVPIQIAQHVDRVQIHDDGGVGLHFQLPEAPDYGTSAAVYGVDHLFGGKNILNSIYGFLLIWNWLL